MTTGNDARTKELEDEIYGLHCDLAIMEVRLKKMIEILLKDCHTCERKTECEFEESCLLMDEEVIPLIKDMGYDV